MRMRLIFCLLVALFGFSPISYGHDDDHEKNHDEKVEEKHEDHESHEDDHDEGHEESPSGASFKAGKGISIKDETRKILGIETASAVEENLPKEMRCNVQVYGDPHHFPGIDAEQTGCDIHGSGFLTEERAALIRPNQKVVLKGSAGQEFEGFVVAIQKPTAMGEAEVIIGVLNAESSLKDGQFLEAIIAIDREKVVITIPAAAILKTVENTFVYVVKGDYYQRIAVKVGNTTDGKTEIIEGISAGDSVVVKPVETLWLIELRATKGGGHSH